MSFGIGAGPSGRRPPGFSQYADLPTSSATPPSSPFQSPQRLLPSFGVVEAQEQAFPSLVNFGVTSQLKRSRSTSPVNYAGASQSKRTRSPDENFSEKLTRASLGLDDWRGQIASPSLASIHPNFYNNAATAQTNQGEIALSLKRTSDVELVPQGNIFDENTPKNVMTINQRRENLPAFLSSQLSPQSNKNLAVDDSEREALAKAKRLARFSKELSEPLKVFRKENLPGKRQGDITDETEKVSIESLKEDTVNGSPCDGKEGIKPSNVVGLCPDMCPES